MALLFVGAMSGTSVDGLDLAMIDVEPVVPRIIDATTEPIPDPLADSLRALALPATDDLNRMARADAELGELIGRAARAFAGDRPVRAIGSHGQTIRHDPRAEPAHTVQIGDPHRIAEISGIDTVADFRRRDMAAGGEGAPLVPPFHETLFRPPKGERVVANIGGISNITILSPDHLTGFDTGPGNALLDAWIREHQGLPFDRNGAWSATGNVIPDLLTNLEQDGFCPRAAAQEHRQGFLQPRLLAKASHGFRRVPPMYRPRSPNSPPQASPGRSRDGRLPAPTSLSAEGVD